MAMLFAKKNRVVLKPPMGWNSWDCFAANVTEVELLENAKVMEEKLKKFGWEYVVCDIQWSETHSRRNGCV
jgi:alpha-galactosidase